MDPLRAGGPRATDAALSGRLRPHLPAGRSLQAVRRCGRQSRHLFEIEHHGYRLPLSLRYSPSPLTPGYNYDVFGRGWALSVSSCISRSIEGMPDERCGFELDTEELMKYYSTPNYGGVIPDDLNLKYDPFSVVMPDGSSFDFFMLKDGQGKMQYIVSNHRRVKISPILSSNGNDITAFKVTDEQGIEYDFSGADISYPATSGGTVTLYGNAYVSWQLTSIRLPHSDELITFTYGKTLEPAYGRQQQEPAVRFHRLYYYSGSPENYDITYYTQTQQFAYRMKLLTEISYGTTQIKIDYTDNGNTAAYNYADRIRILDRNTLVRAIDFTQHQSDVWSSLLGSGLKCSTLDSVTLMGGDESASETYTCGYAGTTYHFSGTDHWGYLNQGASIAGVANLNLFMEFDVSMAANGSGFVRELAKDAGDVSPFCKAKLAEASVDFRTPSSAASHCLLERLTYPTGGYTEFTFENHEFWSHTDSSGDYVPNEKSRTRTKAAGFRIREIADYEADGTCSGRRVYGYGTTYGAGYLHSGTGEPTADPTVETYLSFEASPQIPMFIPYMVKGLSPQGKHETFVDVFHRIVDHPIYDFEYSCTFSVLNFRRLLDGRQAVVYPEVTVYYVKGAGGDCSPANCEGRTVYKYDIYEPGPEDTLFFEYPRYFGQVLYYDPQPYRYNLLKEQLDYESDGQAYKLVRQEKRTWLPGGSTVTGYDYHNPFGGFNFIPVTALQFDFFTTTWRQVGDARLSRKEVTTFDKETGASYTEVEQYGYAYADVLSAKTRDAGGLHRKWELIHPQETDGAAADSMEQKLFDRNMLSSVLREKSSSGNGRKYEYAEFTVDGGGKRLLPARVYDTYYSMEFLHTEILSYTRNGNPLETVTKDGLHTVYLWSYGDRCLVAEIRNATLQQVEAALSALFGKDADALAASATVDGAKLRSLRNQSQLADAQVTVFTHKPLTGVTSVTDPSGRTVYYEYDAMGRLKECYYYEGGTKRALEEYEYHFTNP